MQSQSQNPSREQTSLNKACAYIEKVSVQFLASYVVTSICSVLILDLLLVASSRFLCYAIHSSAIKFKMPGRDLAV